MTSCPLYTNKKVKDEFNDIVKAFGGKPMSDDEFKDFDERDKRLDTDRQAVVAAYKIWDLTNGNGIERAPNGLPSELFLSLLTHFNGDRDKSIRTKANMLSDGFISDFGLYLNGVDDTRLELDKNGEPTLESLSKDTHTLITEKEIGKISQDFKDHFDLDDNKISLHMVNNTPFAYSNDVVKYVLDSYGDKLDPVQKLFYKLLLDTNVPIKFMPLTDGTVMESNVGGISITPFGAIKPKSFAADFLHEMIHQYTTSTIDAENKTPEQLEFFNTLEDIRNTAINLLSKKQRMLLGDELYGLNNSHEFISEFIANPTFRNFLTERNLFLRVIDAITGLFKSVKVGNVNLLDKFSTDKISSILQDLVTSNLNKESVYDINSYSRVRMRDIVNLIKGETNDSEVLQSPVDKTFTDIKKGLLSIVLILSKRLNVSKGSLYNMRNALDKLLKMDSKEGIYHFINDVAAETTQSAYDLTHRGNLSDISSSLLMNLLKNYLGFYLPMLRSIKRILDTSDEFKDIQSIYPEESYDHFNDVVNNMLLRVLNISNLFDTAIDVKSRKYLTDYAAKFNDPTIKDLIHFLDTGDKDISWLGAMVGMTSSLNNDAIKIVNNAVRNSKTDTQQGALKFGKKLIFLYSKLLKKYGRDFLLDFYEKDADGKTTQFFVRDRNYGLHDRNYRLMLATLADKYKLERDQDNNIMLPLYGDKDFDKVWDEIDDWHANNTDRRYTREYYKLHRQMSPEAREAVDDIQALRNRLLQPTFHDGEYHTEELSPEDAYKLDALKAKRAALMSPLDEMGEVKTGESKEIADNLREFLKKLSKNVLYVTDKVGYEKARAVAELKFGANSDKYKMWLYMNNTMRVDEDLYSSKSLEDSLDLKDPTQKQLYDLIQLKRAILKPYRKPYSFGYNYDIMPSDLSGFKENLGKIESLIDRLKDVLSIKGDGKFFDNFNIRTDPRFQEEYNKLLEKARAEGTDFYNSPFYLLNTYLGYKNGVEVRKLLSIHKNIIPNNLSKVKLQPNSIWLKLDPESNWVNEKYTGNGRIMPSIDKYDNTAAFNKIALNKELFGFYNQLIDGMRESNGMVSFLGNRDEYKMPCMSGRLMATLKKNGGIFDSLKYITANSVWKAKDLDEDYYEKYNVRPDGSSIKSIPVPYTGTLDDPSKMTTDLLGSVIKYRESCLNFLNMSSIQDDMEMLLSRIQQVEYHNKGKFKPAGATNIAKRLENLLDTVMYGQHTTPIEVTIKGKKYNLSKFLGNVMAYTGMANLADNIWPMLLILSYGNMQYYLEGSLGKYFDAEDTAFGEALYLKALPTMMAHLGNKTHINKLLSVMEYNNISRPNDETLARLDLSAFMRALNGHFWYNGYDFADFTMKSKSVAANYHSYRLVTNKDGSKEFMNKQLFIEKYYANDKAAGNKEFKKFGTTLWDAYDPDENNFFTLKDEFKSYVSRDLEHLIKNRSEELCGRLHGTISESDRSIMHANAFGKFIGQHRNLYISFILNRLKPRQFNYNLDEMEEGTFRTVAHLISNTFSLKKFNIIKAGWENYKNMLPFELYNLKRVTRELTMAAAATMITTMGIMPWADDDKNNWFKQALSYVALRSTFDIMMMYNPIDISNTFLSPSASLGSLQNMMSFIKLFWIPGWFTQDNPLSSVDTGPYKGVPKVVRSMIKATPFRSIVELPYASNVRSKRAYLEHHMMF